MNLDLKGLQKLAEIGRHRWDPIILAQLAEGPRRRRQLTQEVINLRGEHISDGVLSAVLKRLRAEGLVIRRRVGARNVEYRATPLALAKIELLQRVSELAAELESAEPGDQSSSHGQARPS